METQRTLQKPTRAKRGAWCAAWLCLMPLGLASQGRPKRDAATPPLRELNNAIEFLVRRVSPAVVQVLVTALGSVEAPGRAGVLEREHILGSGVVVDSGGFILTNAHVVTGAQQVRVVLTEPTAGGEAGPAAALPGPVLSARVIGVDKETDLAVLKVDTAGLPALGFGDSDRLRKGELVFAFGSPAGLANSVTMGVVSSTAREADPERPLVYIQTDAAINPGNSGGALVDADGALVGINTFILTQGGGSEGLGFAIPTSIAQFIYRQLRTYGHVHRSIIGIKAQEITPLLAKALGLARNWGVLVSDVAPGGPAAGAGLAIGDVVVGLNGRPVGTLPEFVAGVTMRSGGRPVRVEVLRGSTRLAMDVPVIEQRDSIDRLLGSVDAEKNLVRRIGILGVPIDPDIARMIPGLRQPGGILVVARTLYASGVESGLSAGDVIHAVNGTTVTTLEELRTALRGIKSGDPVALQIEREGGFLFLAFELF